LKREGAAYDEHDKVNVMNVAWGQICDEGKIVNVKAEEAVLNEKGKVDPARLHALMFDQFTHGYYATGHRVGQAWNAGAPLMKK
jgi:hypothetical protein